jgi:hypothetical protein
MEKLMHNLVKVVSVSITLLLLASCGGGTDSTTEDDTSVTDSSAPTTLTSDSNDSSEDERLGDEDTINESTTVTVGDVEISDLGFAKLTATDVTLPDAMLNAKEVYQLAHYIGRTDSEQDEEDIDIPIRSYTATCDVDTNEPRMFVSLTLAKTDISDSTYGSIFEMKYDPATSSFVETGNSAILPQCYESHGVTASADCSRIAVLCNTEYRASEKYGVDKDLIELYGSSWMKWEDNHDEIDGLIQNQIGSLIVNNSSYRNFFTSHPSLTMADFLTGLQENFPDGNFDESTTFSDFKKSSFKEEMAYIVSQLSTSDLADLHQQIREQAYKENDQIWLMEWDNQSLSVTPKSYVVNKMHGGTHLGAQELIYTHDDSQGRTSYAFSVTARVFDSSGNSHYSAGLTVVNRDNWKMNLHSGGSGEERGWYWDCGYGHDSNIRAFYNLYNESYGALCTSDATRTLGSIHGALGTIGIKMEGSSNSSSGRTLHYVPATNAMVTNGGGHTVVPVNASTNLVLIVAPKLITDDDMDRFLTDTIGVDITSGKSFESDCGSWDEVNCFQAYLAENRWSNSDLYFTIPGQDLYSSSNLKSSSLTRIGIAKANEKGSVFGERFEWIVEDDDCQISDPQLVDLKNGRFLLGYAKFQCISDGLGYNRLSNKSGSKRMLVPKAYYLMEIDVDGNIQSGPTELPNHGWGGAG